MNLAGKTLVRLVNYIQQIVKIKNPRYPPPPKKNLNRRLPAVINKKPENQHNFQRVKHHAVNDRNIRHEEPRLGNRRKSKRIIMYSDSIPKGIRIREFNCYITNATARLKSFPGAASKELAHYVVPTLQEESFNLALIHIGINDILKDQSDSQCESLTRNILEISQKCKEHGIEKIIISSLIVTESINLNLLARVNASLCNSVEKMVFVSLIILTFLLKIYLKINYIYLIQVRQF